MGEHIPPGDCYAHGRACALKGRALYANPHLGGDADDWRRGYLAVPEAERGSQPTIATAFRSITQRRTSGYAAFNAPRGGAA